MDEPIFDTTFNESGGAIVRWNNGPRKFVRYFNTSLYKKNNDSCWYIYNPIPSSRSSFMEGCGLLKFEDSNNGPTSIYEKNLVYYKKGNETWGLPFENLSLKNIEKPLISVFPNPISNAEMLNINNNSEQYNIFITNLLGEEILVKENNRGNSKIPLDNLKSGLYFVKIITNNQSNFTQKLMVK
jgi:hypothetical protein